MFLGIVKYHTHKATHAAATRANAQSKAAA